MSIIEIVTVFGIILLLVAMLVPGLQKAKEQARRVQCANNLRQLGLALRLYLDDTGDYIPTEGSTQRADWLTDKGVWYNVLPPYVDMPSYGELEGVNVQIRELKNGQTWVCPSKDLTGAYKSLTGKNQFHYAMNQVLDGMGGGPDGSRDTPGFPDAERADPIPARVFRQYPQTVILFDIAPNSPSGSPRDVSNQNHRDFRGDKSGRYHGDFANLLCLDGRVVGVTAGDLYSPRDNRSGTIRWRHPEIYWGYPRPKR